MKILHADDHSLFREGLGFFLRLLDAQVVALEAGNFQATLDKLALESPVDLLLLDIKMPDVSGIELLRSIPNPPMVIFTTAYSEHAIEGFELDAIDYLLKPFSLTRFLKACNKAYEYYELKKNKNNDASGLSHVYIKSGYDQVRVELDSILYAEASGNYVVFMLEQQRIASRLTMNEAEALLPGKYFVRVHRSYIVSKKHIQKIDKKAIRVQQTEIPIGPAYMAEVEKIIR